MNPVAYKKAQQEVDQVLGQGQLQPQHLSKLVYLDQVLKETLRLWPTAPVFALECETNQVIGDKYTITPDQVVLILVLRLHRDRSVWAEDAEEFNPDRMSPEKFAALPKHAWKPFGNGSRSCIGRDLAKAELRYILAAMFWQYEAKRLPGDDGTIIPSGSLTIKPDGGLYVSLTRWSDA